MVGSTRGSPKPKSAHTGSKILEGLSLHFWEWCVGSPSHELKARCKTNNQSPPHVRTAREMKVESSSEAGGFGVAEVGITGRCRPRCSRCFLR